MQKVIIQKDSIFGTTIYLQKAGTLVKGLVCGQVWTPCKEKALHFDEDEVNAIFEQYHILHAQSKEDSTLTHATVQYVEV